MLAAHSAVSARTRALEHICRPCLSAWLRAVVSSYPSRAHGGCCPPPESVNAIRSPDITSKHHITSAVTGSHAGRWVLQVRFKRFLWLHLFMLLIAAYNMQRAAQASGHLFLPNSVKPATASAITLTLDALVPPISVWFIERRSRLMFLQQDARA